MSWIQFCRGITAIGAAGLAGVASQQLYLSKEKKVRREELQDLLNAQCTSKNCQVMRDYFARMRAAEQAKAAAEDAEERRIRAGREKIYDTCVDRCRRAVQYQLDHGHSNSFHILIEDSRVFVDNKELPDVHFINLFRRDGIPECWFPRDKFRAEVNQVLREEFPFVQLGHVDMNRAWKIHLSLSIIDPEK